MVPPVGTGPTVCTGVLLVPHDEVGDTYNVAAYGGVPPLHVAWNVTLCPASRACAGDGDRVGVDKDPPPTVTRSHTEPIDDGVGVAPSVTT